MDKEPEVQNIRSPKPKQVENKPFMDNRDFVLILCIICSALITYLLCDKNVISYDDNAQLAAVVATLTFFMALSMFWVTQKIVRNCYIRAKRKADNKVD